MKIRVKVISNGPFDIKAYPQCQRSERVCMLIEKPYLTGNQVKLLQLIGFEIEVVKENK